MGGDPAGRGDDQGRNPEVGGSQPALQSHDLDLEERKTRLGINPRFEARTTDEEDIVNRYPRGNQGLPHRQAGKHMAPGSGRGNRVSHECPESAWCGQRSGPARRQTPDARRQPQRGRRRNEECECAWKARTRDARRYMPPAKECFGDVLTLTRGIPLLGPMLSDVDEYADPGQT